MAFKYYETPFKFKKKDGIYIALYIPTKDNWAIFIWFLLQLVIQPFIIIISVFFLVKGGNVYDDNPLYHYASCSLYMLYTCSIPSGISLYTIMNILMGGYRESAKMFTTNKFEALYADKIYHHYYYLHYFDNTRKQKMMYLLGFIANIGSIALYCYYYCYVFK